MTPHRLIDTGIAPALAELEKYGIKDSVDARRMLVAIALQESALEHRRQVVHAGTETGPAVSFWQGEITGGMCLTLFHEKTGKIMRSMCSNYNVDPTPRGLWEAMRFHDIIAATAARLLLYTLPHKLPTTPEDAWQQYLSAWRPGKPKPGSWSANWDAATLSVGLKL